MKQLDTVISNIVGDGRLLTVQPGGNHGDTLIYKGFNKYISGTDIDTIPLNQGTPRRDSPYKFPSLNLRRNAKTLLLNVKYLKKAFRDNISAVYMHGGAGFSDFWEAGIDCYTTIARYFDCPIIIGPSTCQFNTTNPTHIFNNVDNETHFFCREKYSYKNIENAAAECNHVSVYLEDDTALFLDKKDLPVNEFDDRYTLLGMRTDKSSASPIIKEDIKKPIKVRDVSLAEESVAGLVNEVAKASYVYTDRLHVMILASILEKPVTGFDVTYYKNRGVYEYSLSNSPNVDFQYLR